MPFTTTAVAEGSRLYTVPSAVIAPPGESVCPLTKYSVPENVDSGKEPMAVAPGLIVDVTPLTTIAVAEGKRL